MDQHLPPSPGNFSLKPVPAKDLTANAPPKDWPHAPIHRLSAHGIYFITAGTLHKQHLFDTPAKRDLLERMLLSLSKALGWQLEAWAVLSNHYHFVARGQPDSTPMREFVRELHSRSAIDLNRLDGMERRTAWHNFRDTRLTYQYSYLARLNYVHQNPVRHGVVALAENYKWCSASWFIQNASPAFVKSVKSFKIEKVNVPDDF